MTYLLRKFPNTETPPNVSKAKGSYVYLENGTKYLDATSGWTSYATLGYCNDRIMSAMQKQMTKFTHIDYNIWNNPMIEELAERLLNHATNGLDKVYFGGTSGSDAIEAALKLSYQIHYDNGKPQKTKYIARDQSFNGATLHSISTSDLPILDIYNPLLPKNVIKVSQHNPYTTCSHDPKNKSSKKNNFRMGKYEDETNENYLKRCLNEIEQTIIKEGPENICAFVGETILGSLVGDVPALKGYWSGIDNICKQYDIHIILDEVYCGMGRSGKIFNYSWDDFSPDFVCVGKNMTSGHSPLSAIITKSKFEDIIANGSGRIQLGHTFQGYSLGIAACLEYMNIIDENNLMERVREKSKYMIDNLTKELSSNPFFKNIRGRGFQFALEHSCEDNALFGITLQKKMLEEHKIMINSKWHRTSFNPPFIFTDEQIDELLDKFILTFKELSTNWDIISNNVDISQVPKSMGGISQNK